MARRRRLKGAFISSTAAAWKRTGSLPFGEFKCEPSKHTQGRNNPKKEKKRPLELAEPLQASEEFCATCCFCLEEVNTLIETAKMAVLLRRENGEEEEGGGGECIVSLL